jgi:flavin-dependent dehydrogenase
LDFIESHYPEAGSEKKFYAARIPCLSRLSLIQQQVCGKNWALLGDAAGFADPITAEGIYFAMRSAEILGESLERNQPLSYEQGWRNDFGIDLQRAAAWRDRFYGGRLLFRAFAHRALQITCASPRVQQITNMLVAGTSKYRQLRRQLIASSPRILLDAIRSKFQKLATAKS